MKSNLSKIKDQIQRKVWRLVDEPSLNAYAQHRQEQSAQSTRQPNCL